MQTRSLAGDDVDEANELQDLYRLYALRKFEHARSQLTHIVTSISRTA